MKINPKYAAIGILSGIAVALIVNYLVKKHKEYKAAAAAPGGEAIKRGGFLSFVSKVGSEGGGGTPPSASVNWPTPPAS